MSLDITFIDRISFLGRGGASKIKNLLKLGYSFSLFTTFILSPTSLTLGHATPGGRNTRSLDTPLIITNITTTITFSCCICVFVLVFMTGTCAGQPARK